MSQEAPPVRKNARGSITWIGVVLVRISALLRTAKAFDVKKIDLFCAIVV